ncbi:hypothetical protein A3748_09790 [Erythrobacter sp. HI0077]|nr:hypothetical protein A3745_15760 [Erythrobacter sp. HI0074]KZZ08991.1 hypothetical protein A3748_09790 [Erythrobacter sp. HI0077]
MVTADAKLSAQFEHSVTMTADRVEVLRLRDGEQAPTMRMQASPRVRMRLTGSGLSCSLRGNSTGQDAP